MESKLATSGYLSFLEKIPSLVLDFLIIFYLIAQLLLRSNMYIIIDWV